MKSFLFEGIWIVSQAERRARAELFHPRRNLIVGRNHTGKSSLIKTLFMTMGARATGELKKWDPNTVSVVGFSIDSRSFRVVHQNKCRALFNSNGELLFCSSVHAEWSEQIARLLGFNLVLSDKESDATQADLRCFFLPFYINQDGSWQAQWNTFSGLQQYRKPVDSILDYFAGIKPPRYYEISSARTQAQRTLEDLRRKLVFLEKARDQVGKAIGPAVLNLHLDQFLFEVSDLARQVTDLNRQQEGLRDDVVREEEGLSAIHDQIRLAEAALATYSDDAEFLRTKPHQPLTCPTCGAEHAQPFLEFLGYAEDARVLRELVTRLHSDATVAARRCQNARGRLNDVRDGYQRMNEILDIRRGEVRFGDVVNRIALESAESAFEEESIGLAQESEILSTRLRDLDADMKRLTDSARSKAILAVFRSAYAEALVDLNLPPVDSKQPRLTSRPSVSGSGGPRSILAYYAALWRASTGPHGSFLVPLVVDSPNQQGQDDINLPKVLAFLSESLPISSQVIVGSEIDTPHPFENRISLSSAYRLLEESQYEAVFGLVGPLLSKMQESLSGSAVS